MRDDSKKNQTCLLEVIACTVEDAVEAMRGGANRLEIISRFDVGGLTPPIDLVREIKAKISLPLRVMLRESEGYGGLGEAEIEKLSASARELNEIGIDGVVLGFLRDDGEIDFELTKRVLGNAPKLKATFHHAFEDAADKFAAIEKLKKLGQIDRILAHGGQGSWAEKISRLGDYATAAEPGIKILAGGGIDIQVISMIRAGTSITEFHVGRAARMEDAVDASQVAVLAATLKEKL
jgi:copper homeostasis protein